MRCFDRVLVSESFRERLPVRYPPAPPFDGQNRGEGSPLLLAELHLQNLNQSKTAPEAHLLLLALPFCLRTNLELESCRAEGPQPLAAIDLKHL
jgi:hypothetical protein